MCNSPANREFVAVPADHDPVMRALRILAGGVVHEYNNILGGVLGYSSYLEGRADEGSELQADLHQIRDAAETGVALTRRLQGFAQRHQFRRRSVPVGPLLETVRRRLVEDRDADVNARLDGPDVLPPIAGQQDGLQDVLLALGHNALDALDGDRGSVSFRAEAATLDGTPGVRIEVGDAGVGIPRDIIPHVVTPFFTTRKAAGHLGLGLSMACGIIANHDGRLWIASLPGRGTTVALWLPAATDQDLAPAEDEAAVVDPVGGTERILVVDDEPTIRSMVAAVLRGYGYQVLCAASGMEALERVHREEEPIDLVVMDLSMPGKGGEETCRELHALQPKLPVLIATGSVRQGSLESRLAETGAAGVVYKPFRSDQLAARVRDTIDRRRLEAE